MQLSPEAYSQSRWNSCTGCQSILASAFGSLASRPNLRRVQRLGIGWRYHEPPDSYRGPSSFANYRATREAAFGSVGPAPESTTERVRRILGKILPEGPCSITTVAPKLGLSERTLQRRLESEESTFGAVLDSVRRELGLRYLKEGNLTLAEICVRAGFFGAQSLFSHRAFKRWTGSTPQALRRGAARRPTR